MMRARSIACLIGATAAMLWLSPISVAEPLPGATAKGVAALARRINPTVAAAALDFHAALHKLGTAGVLADPTLVLEAWDVNRQGVGQRRIGIDQELKLWGKYGLERGVAQADADAAKFQGRATERVKLEGASVAEAALRCGISESAVKVNIHRGLQKLATLIARETKHEDG